MQIRTPLSTIRAKPKMRHKAFPRHHVCPPQTTIFQDTSLRTKRERQEFLGSWIHSNGIHEAKRRRAIGEREMEREGERERVRG
jgi:hypothetical protein